MKWEGRTQKRTLEAHTREFYTFSSFHKCVLKEFSNSLFFRQHTLSPEEKLYIYIFYE